MGPLHFGRLMATMGATLRHRRFDDREATRVSTVGRRTSYIVTAYECTRTRDDASFIFRCFGTETETAIRIYRGEEAIRLYSYSDMAVLPGGVFLSVDWDHDFVRENLAEVSPDAILEWCNGFLEKLVKEVGIGNERA